MTTWTSLAIVRGSGCDPVVAPRTATSDAGELEVMTAEIEAGRTVFTVATIEHGVVSAECDHAASWAVPAADGVCVAVIDDVMAAQAADLLDGHLTPTPRSQLDDDVRRRTDDVVARLSPPSPPESE